MIILFIRKKKKKFKSIFYILNKVLNKLIEIFKRKCIFPEPFDFASWMLVALFSIPASTAAILFFEWLSPSGYDMKVQTKSFSSNNIFFPHLSFPNLYRFIFKQNLLSIFIKNLHYLIFTENYTFYTICFLKLYKHC